MKQWIEKTGSIGIITKQVQGYAIVYKGRVIEKEKIGEHKDFIYQVRVADKKTEKIREFILTGPEFHKINEGYLYTAKVKKGMLGIPFKMVWE